MTTELKLQIIVSLGFWGIIAWAAWSVEHDDE